ncbi:MAG: 3-keto-disaccharide hydrolase, partial [Limisphaerales bacterium]
MKTRLLSLLFVAAIALHADAANKLNQPPKGFKALFNGKDFTNWRVDPLDGGHWKIIDGVIDYDALSEAPDRNNKNLWTTKEYGDFELLIDWKIKRTTGLYPMPIVLPDGSDKLDENGKVIKIPRPNADSGIYLRGEGKSQINIWCWPIGSGEVYGYRRDQKMPPEVRAGVTPKMNADKPVGEWNTFKITMKGDRLTVVLNGKKVIDNVELENYYHRDQPVYSEGPIHLQTHGS